MLNPGFAAWLSTPDVASIEMVADIGYDTVLFDAEHGVFDLAALDRVVPLAKALGLGVLVKCTAPERAPLQQALDFGADGVVIPHILSAAHATKVCGFAKFPPIGDRSLAGGRTMGYGGFGAGWTDDQDAATFCFPMIEDASAFQEVEQIAALPTVDGLFLGPGDLSLRRGTGGFFREDADDIARVVAAAEASGKPWILPAWSPWELEKGLSLGAHTILVCQQFTALRVGFEGALADARSAKEAARG